jgi:hypothetical protein
MRNIIREVRGAKRVIPYLATAAVAAAIVWYLGLGTHRQGPAIYQRGAWIVVENQTKMDWSDVQVTINAYYRGLSPKLSAGGRLEAPLSGFTTGLGQRFNPARETIRSVDVRGTSADGKPVSITWDEKTDKPLAEALKVQRGR